METDRARCSDGRQLVRNAAAGYSDASGRKRHGCCRWWVTGLQQPAEARTPHHLPDRSSIGRGRICADMGADAASRARLATFDH